MVLISKQLQVVTSGYKQIHAVTSPVIRHTLHMTRNLKKICNSYVHFGLFLEWKVLNADNKGNKSYSRKITPLQYVDGEYQVNFIGILTGSEQEVTVSEYFQKL